MSLSEFPVSLLLVILHFDSDVGMEAFALRCLWLTSAGFPSFTFL
jgi:hypothetical protein